MMSFFTFWLDCWLRFWLEQMPPPRCASCAQTPCICAEPLLLALVGALKAAEEERRTRR